MTTKALPDGFTVRSKQQWLELLKQQDLAQRGIPNQALRSLGYAPAAYVKMDEATKLSTLLQHQAEAGFGEDGKPLTGGASTAAPKTAAAAAKTAAKTAASTTTAPSGGSGGGDAGLAKQVADLQAQMVELRKENLELSGFIREMHFFQRVIVMSNQDAAALMEDEGVRGDFFGKLAGITGSEESGNG